MSKKFIEPVLGSKTSSSSSKSFIYNSYSGDRIISPYDGEVVSVSDTECGGNIRLKHNFNGKIIYSNFCGVGRSNVLSGQNVYQSKIIGTFGDKEVKFEVIDKDGYKQNISSLMSGEKITNDGEKQKELKVSKSYGDSSSGGIGSNLMKLSLLAPFAALEKLGKTTKVEKKPKKEEEPNDIVFEEIQRIKTLLK